MKKLLILMVSFLSLQNFVFAGQGEAYISHWRGVYSGTGSTGSRVYVSNITNNPIEITFTIYDENGNVLTPTAFSGFTNSNTQLAPKTTGQVKLDTPNTRGFGVITWKNVNSNEDDAVALIAHGTRIDIYTSGYFGSHNVSINNGKPF